MFLARRFEGLQKILMHFRSLLIFGQECQSPDWRGWLPDLQRLSARITRSNQQVQVAPLRRTRLRLTQTRPVISRLGLCSKQRTQLALLLGDKHTDHLPTYLRHAHPAHIRNTF